MIRRAKAGPPVWLVLTTALMIGGCQGPGETGAAIGKPAPVLVGKTLAGDYVRLEDYRGQVVLLNVWATWCKPCTKELPEIQALYRRHRADGLVVVGVSVDHLRAVKQIERTVAQFRLTYPMIHDPGGNGLTSFEIRGYPTSFLLGKTGTMLWRRDGIIEPDDRDLADQLTAALAAPAT